MTSLRTILILSLLLSASCSYKNDAENIEQSSVVQIQQVRGIHADLQETTDQLQQVGIRMTIVDNSQHDIEEFQIEVTEAKDDKQREKQKQQLIALKTFFSQTTATYQGKKVFFANELRPVISETSSKAFSRADSQLKNLIQGLGQAQN